MAEVRPTHDDEIDLFELFEMLWDGKWTITLFVAIAVLLAGSFLLLKEASYESKVIYSIDNIPPFYDADNASSDFQKMFYSANIFNEWKENNSNTPLVFEDFSKSQVLDGFVVSKNEDELFATIASENKGGSFLLVKSNQLPILDDFFKYATHINVLLKDMYIARSKEELKIIEARFKDLSTADSNIVDTILSIDRYIVLAEKGAGVFTIQNPTIPKKASPKSSLILALSIVLGGMVGVFFIIVHNAITKRKEQLVKA